MTVVLASRAQFVAVARFIFALFLLSCCLLVVVGVSFFFVALVSFNFCHLSIKRQLAVERFINCQYLWTRSFSLVFRLETKLFGDLKTWSFVVCDEIFFLIFFYWFLPLPWLVAGVTQLQLSSSEWRFPSKKEKWKFFFIQFLIDNYVVLRGFMARKGFILLLLLLLSLLFLLLLLSIMCSIIILIKIIDNFQRKFSSSRLEEQNK